LKPAGAGLKPGRYDQMKTALAVPGFHNGSLSHWQRHDGLRSGQAGEGNAGAPFLTDLLSLNIAETPAF